MASSLDIFGDWNGYSLASPLLQTSAEDEGVVTRESCEVHVQKSTGPRWILCSWQRRIGGLLRSQCNPSSSVGAPPPTRLDMYTS